MKKILSKLNLVFCFLMAVMISANVAYAADCYQMQNGIPASGALSEVWGSSSSDVFAVGYEFTGGSVREISWSDLNLDAPRPVYSEIASSRGIQLPTIWDAVERWRKYYV